MKISHEMPIQLLKEGVDKEYNDYFYALVHLFDESREYYEYTVNTLKEGREVILDNSIFELEEAFSIPRFISKIDQLIRDVGSSFNPDKFYYIVPDVLDNMAETIQNALNFPYNEVKGKAIAVVQGKSIEELEKGYITLSSIPSISKIGISFNCKAYEKGFQHSSQLENWMHGRQLFLETLYHRGELKKPLHLLGCSLPKEFIYYKERSYYNIDSIDTSNPVVHGLRGDVFTSLKDIDYKRSEKLADMFFENFSNLQIQDVIFNIKVFRKEILK